MYKLCKKLYIHTFYCKSFVSFELLLYKYITYSKTYRCNFMPFLSQIYAVEWKMESNTIKIIIIALWLSDYRVLLFKIVFNVSCIYNKNKGNEK